MRLLGNVIWFIFGGIELGLTWLVVGLIAFISIIGIPWGRACFTLANFAFFPFGRELIAREELNQESDIGTGILGSLGNIVWLIVAGWWLALIQLLMGIVFCITIIGIPFGIQWFKLARASLFPVGQSVVSKELSALSRRVNADSADPK